MIPKYIFGLVAVAAFLNGCCCAASDLAESGGFCAGPTFSQSCEKSCSALSYTDYSSCLYECKDLISQEGFDPDSCCPDEYKMRNICEIECSYNEYSGPGTCVENCGSLMYQEMGLGLDDCIVPA
ncbi:MAG: hypothetical protein AB1295_04570 [Candidatus Micrarchaeota archaeon]